MNKDEKIKQEVLQERAALLEMYKAGFLDGYRVKNRTKTAADYLLLNAAYRKAFMQRFEKKITKALKKK